MYVLTRVLYRVFSATLRIFESIHWWGGDSTQVSWKAQKKCEVHLGSESAETVRMGLTRIDHIPLPEL